MELPLSDLQLYFVCRNKDKDVLVVPPKSRERLKYDHVGNTCCVYGVYKMQSAVTDIKVNVKWSRNSPGVAQRVGRGIALLFHDRGTRRGFVISSTPRPHFIPGKELVPILQKAGWAPGPVWTGGKSRPHRDSIPDRPARSQSRYRLRYRAHSHRHTVFK